jgi:putative thioredoxin
MTDRFADSNVPDLAGKPPAPPTGAGGLGLGHPRANAAPRAEAGPAGAVETPATQPSYIIDVDGQAAFQALVAQSATVPVVIDFWATWCEPCKRLSPVLEALTGEFGGRLVLAKVDVDKSPEIAAAFQVQSVPSVVALVQGRGLPLFNGAVPAATARQFFEELLKAAAQVGVTGTVDPAALGGAAPVPPLRQAGHDAFERGDLAAARQAFTKALAESPADHVAKAALAQIGLQERLAADPAAGATDSLAAVLAQADREVAAGQFAVGFGRLLEALRAASPEGKDRLRLRLLDLFEVAGPDDPTVAQARRRLASILF